MTDQTLDLRGQNATLQTELAEARQQRDEWHRRANDMSRAIGAAGAEHLRNRGALIRELADLRAELATVTEERDRLAARFTPDAIYTRTHDGIRSDKAIRPRGQA